MSRHAPKQTAIAQKLYTGGGGEGESSLPALSKKFKMGSIGIPSKTLVTASRKICRDGVVLTKMYLLLHLLEEPLLILSVGSSVAQNKNLRSDF